MRRVAAILAATLILVSLSPDLFAQAGEADDSAGEPPSRREVEAELVARVAPTACRRWREQDEPFDFGASGAIQCPDPAPGIRQLALFSFPDDAALDKFWAWRRDRLSPRPADDPSSCRHGNWGASQGALTAEWAHGELVCYGPGRGTRVAKIRWTDERTDTYGVLDATDRDTWTVFEAWLEHTSSGDPDAVPGGAVSDPIVPVAVEDVVRDVGGLVGDPARCRVLTPTLLAIDQPEAIAGVACEGPSRRDTVAERYYRFDTRQAAERWWARTLAEAPDGGLEAGKGTFRTCLFSTFGQLYLAGETGWVSTDGSSEGRVACWMDPWSGAHLRWLDADRLVGGAAPGDINGFVGRPPRRLERFAKLAPGEPPHEPFVDPVIMQPLPGGLGDEPPKRIKGFGRVERFPAQTDPGAAVGVVYPVGYGHCDGIGFPIDFDGSWWDAVGGVDAEAAAVRERSRRHGIDEGGTGKFLMLNDQEAQLRTATGYVFAYERHDGPRRLYPCA